MLAMDSNVPMKKQIPHIVVTFGDHGIATQAPAMRSKATATIT